MLALLPTKLAIPPLRPEVVARPRLLGLMAAVDRVPLTVVTALAGFGKTTLLAAWTASWPWTCTAARRMPSRPQAKSRTRHSGPHCM